MTREEIIAHLDSEINLLLRARDILATPLAEFIKADLVKVVPRKVKPKPAEKVRKPEVAPVAVAAPVPAPAPVHELEPQVHRVPPKRRMERRQAHAEKPGPGAALSGHVPAGPVAVSANEARKMQERTVPAPALPLAVELRPEPASERSLGSLIQAFERRTGLSGLEIP